MANLNHLITRGLTYLAGGAEPMSLVPLVALPQELQVVAGVSYHGLRVTALSQNFSSSLTPKLRIVQVPPPGMVRRPYGHPWVTL